MCAPFARGRSLLSEGMVPCYPTRYPHLPGRIARWLVAPGTPLRLEGSSGGSPLLPFRYRGGTGPPHLWPSVQSLLDSKRLWCVARPRGVEPRTCELQNRCSAD